MRSIREVDGQNRSSASCPNPVTVSSPFQPTAGGCLPPGHRVRRGDAHGTSCLTWSGGTVNLRDGRTAGQEGAASCGSSGASQPGSSPASNMSARRCNARADHRRSVRKPGQRSAVTGPGAGRSLEEPGHGRRHTTNTAPTATTISTAATTPQTTATRDAGFATGELDAGLRPLREDRTHPSSVTRRDPPFPQVHLRNAANRQGPCRPPETQCIRGQRAPSPSGLRPCSVQAQVRFPESVETSGLQNPDMEGKWSP
jgi:hypothetical protein